jgi:hypothetical protein
LFAAVKEQLITSEAVRLVGLLAHLLYWTALPHIHQKSQRLPEQAKQSLVLTIQELWAAIQAPARQRLGRRGELLTKDGPAGISFVIPAFMLALKRGVEWCFQTAHPWIFQEPATTTHLIDQVNVMFMRLFDPDCLYASFGALEASERAIALWHKLAVSQASLGITPGKRMLNQAYRVTPLMSLLMRSGVAPGDAKTRVLLAKTTSESMINPQVDITKPNAEAPLEGWRRGALYRSANKRLAGLQRAGHETAAGKAEKAANAGFMKSSSLPNLRSKTRSGTITRSSERTSTVGSESVKTLRTA